MADSIITAVVQDNLLLEDGRLLIYEREGIYQARIRIDKNKYLYRSLGTRNRHEAVGIGKKLIRTIDARIDNGQPATALLFGQVISEYVSYRETQHQQGSTSGYMLRQIKRVSKFWVQYLGDREVPSIGDRELSGYPSWRRAYYSQLPVIPRNAKLNPTDKTLQWEVMLGKAIIKWAAEKGYRGTVPAPTFTFKVKRKRVRPAFEISEYRLLLRALVSKWKRAENDHWKYARAMLTLYVLFLANSGMRVGEANNLKLRDIQQFRDELGRRNYYCKVSGKTGQRDVIMRASAAKVVDRLLAYRKGRSDEWLFQSFDGSRITTVIEPFNHVLAQVGLLTNSHGEKFTLYSLRHTYAVMALRRGVDVFAIARNMGTSVQIIQSYYGKHATPMKLATQLGG